MKATVNGPLSSRDLITYGAGPFADTLWYTMAVKLGMPVTRRCLATVLHQIEILTDYTLLLASKLLGAQPILKGFYEVVIVMQSPEALKIMAFLIVRFIFDSYLNFGYGFCPEIGFIKRWWSPSPTARPSIRRCWMIAISSLAAIMTFHLIAPQMNPGALGAAGPFILGAEQDHLIGLSIIAELISSFFFYASFIVAFRCSDTNNRVLLKLAINLAGVYLVKQFTFDTNVTGSDRDPLKCWSAAFSSSIENQDWRIFFINSLIHFIGVFTSCYVFSPIPPAQILLSGQEGIFHETLDESFEAKDARDIELKRVVHKDVNESSKDK